MKTQVMIVQGSANVVAAKKSPRLCLAGKNETAGQRIRSVLLKIWTWIERNYEQGERIHAQITNQKEEAFLKQMKNGVPPRMF